MTEEEKAAFKEKMRAAREAKKEGGGGKVGVEPKTELQQVLDRLASMEREREKDRETIKMLTAVADKSQLAKYEAKQDRKIVRVVKVSTYQGHVVRSWKSVMDRVWKDNDDTWHERQTYQLKLENGTTVDLDIRNFTSDIIKVPAKVLERKQYFSEDANGVEVLHETFRLGVEDAKGREKELELDGRFVN